MGESGGGEGERDTEAQARLAASIQKQQRWRRKRGAAPVADPRPGLLCRPAPVVVAHLSRYIVRGVENYPVILGDLQLPASARLKLHKIENIVTQARRGATA